jgi:glycosyltransferase involved in cell wall biosynthesis
MVRAGTYVFGRWDVIHYNYGKTLFSTLHTSSNRTGIARLLGPVLNGVAAVLQRWELAILRVRRIPVFVHYQGDDARQGDYSRAHFEVSIATQVPSGYYTAEGDKWKRSQIELMARHAAKIYAVNPDLMNVLPPSAEFLPYGHIALDDLEPRYTQADRDRLVFAHAPSHRRVKGTDVILQALDELAAEGYSFDLDLIEGLDNATAIARYADADVVIDQLYAGWYGGVALEAMALGKPVVVYLRESDFRFLPDGMAEELPFFRATPTTIKDDLRSILDMPRADLVTRGKRSRTFAEKWHNPVEITSRIAADYRQETEKGKTK